VIACPVTLARNYNIGWKSETKNNQADIFERYRSDFAPQRIVNVRKNAWENTSNGRAGYGVASGGISLQKADGHFQVGFPFLRFYTSSRAGGLTATSGSTFADYDNEDVN
jgi:hypothetical protein